MVEADRMISWISAFAEMTQLSGFFY